VTKSNDKSNTGITSWLASTEFRPKWQDPPAEPGEWLVGLRVRILDCKTSMWYAGVVVRAEDDWQGGGQKWWLVCFADGPRTELLLPGTWQCHTEDCPAGLQIGAAGISASTTTNRVVS
jgi:hypothetical protein